jgi:predicted PolB exonuclease-like 3'-5' exonuclease
MLTQQQLENILLLDIETVCMVSDYHDLPERMQALWDHKARKYMQPDLDKGTEELFWDKGGIHAEFGKVVCISCGYLRFDEQGLPTELRMKSFAGDNEKELLEDFGQTLNQFTKKPGRRICAHNGKEFDFPYLGRRYLIQQLEVPYALQVQGKKPWETPFLDTMELWKFGDYKSYTSLDLLTAIFDIPSSKDDMDGSQVSEYYWHRKALDEIKTYCEKDVKATAQVLLRMCGMPLLS